ncbi:MAG: efflux RND transporter periplasmic adaptor subunit [Kordiimonas sp.]
MEDKSELLSQLKIDRTEETPSSGVSAITVGALMIAAAAAGGAGAWAFLGTEAPSVETSTPIAKVNKVTPSTPKPAVTATEPSAPAAAPSVDPSEKILNASGYITARRMATVSAQIMGLITEVNVEEGMSVTTGQVLATLDSAVATVNLDFADAQVAVAKARLGRINSSLAEAKRVLERTKELNKANFSSEADLTRAQADVESFEADLISARADIRVSELEAQRQRERLDDHTIKAPFGGVVTVKNAQPGEIVAPSSAGGGFTRTGICTIVDMDSLEIEVDVNEAFIGRVFEGQKVEANLDAYPNWRIPASVIAVIPTADRAKATVRVRIRIEEKDARILPDMGVKVAFLRA